MGQNLSCVSKKKKTKEDLKKPKAKKLQLKGKKNEILVQETISPTSNAGVNATAPITDNSQLVNHASPEADSETVRRRPKLVLLKPAPAKSKLPSPLPQQVSTKVTPPLSKTQFGRLSQANRVSPASIHSPQTVDQVAREVAQSEARPATWADLHWALIGSRELTTDSERIRALFSWLCSIPLNRNVFATHEELEQGVKDGIPYAAELKQAKDKIPNPDSPETVINDLTNGKSTYLRAFESLCRYSAIPCCTIKGLAKGVDYTVGMQLTDHPLPPDGGDNTAIGRIQHAWSAAYVDGNWALFDSMWAAERLAMSANARLSQIAQVGHMEYETDMFYFNADPAIFVHSHFPFEQDWQLLNPPMSLGQFQDGVLLKPAFFTHGLGLFSHQEGVVHVQSKLIIKLSIPPSLIKMLLFTFNLKIDGQDELIRKEGVNLSTFGMHEISTAESVVTFSFRFPKCGAYKLTIYARKVGDPLFTDVCEYRVEAKGMSTDLSPGGIDVPPFPPTSQSHYGPTEKASELKIRIVPSDSSAVCKCPTGVLEVRFATTDPTIKLPKITARLKSLLHEASMLTDCILVRVAEASPSLTLSSYKSRTSSSTTEFAFPVCVITAYLPSAGEYALEVYGAPADADEDASYFLVWQLMVDADCGVQLPTPVRKRLATTNLGPQDSTWEKLGLKAVSHPDPLIHVPTKATAGIRSAKSKNELMQQFVKQSEKLDREQQEQPVEDGPQDTTSSNAERDDATATGGTPGPRSCDLEIVLEKPISKQLCIVGQLVDITETTDEDRTTYLLQQVDESDNQEAAARGVERITYLVRIPHGDQFYKLYLYAALVEADPSISLPLVYTYLIEAPQRLMSAEVPYIGVKYGPFPEKLEQQEQAKEKQTKK